MVGQPDFTGNQNISEQTLGKVATEAEITANTSNQLDIDINNVDINSDPYISDEVNVSGSKEIVAGITSTGSYTVTLEWTDGNNNTEFTETFTDPRNDKLLVTTASTHVIIKIEDESGSSNPTNATVNAH